MDAITTFYVCVIVHFVIIAIRDWQKIYYRKPARSNIENSLEQGVKRGLLEFRPGKKIPYIAKLGKLKNPKKVIVKYAGIHGLEYFSIETLLLFLLSFNRRSIRSLEKEGILLIIIPVVNWWGFRNYMRTNENGVDLARNYTVPSIASPLALIARPWPFKAKIRYWPIVAGWGFSWKLVDILSLVIILPLSLLFVSTDYFRGFKVQDELLELRDELDTILRSDIEVIISDYHTGNTSPITTIWRQEFDTREGVPHHLSVVYRKQNLDKLQFVSGSIDYITYGGFAEGISQEYSQYREHLSGFTVELAVLNKAGSWYSFYRYMITTIFECYPSERKEMINKELVNMQERFFEAEAGIFEEQSSLRVVV